MKELEILDYKGEGYFSPYSFEGWKVAFLNHAERFTSQGIAYLERHKETDEVFVLLSGQATLLIGAEIPEEKTSHSVPVQVHKNEMEPGQLYIVKKNAWHNIMVSEDAKVLIVENADTCRENTEYMEYKSSLP